MKKFVVSDKCIACGSCLLETNLLQEDAEGKAVPVAGGYISADFLPKAQEIAAVCPVKALSIEEAENVDLNKLPEKLKKALNEITVPNVTRKDVEMHAQDYRMTYSSPQGEYRYDYSSESRAMSAAESEFDRICYSQYKKFILELFVQYKEDKLRKFYTFDESGFWGQINKQYADVLQKFAGAAAAGGIKLPADFKEFAVFPGGSKDSTLVDIINARLKEFEDRGCSDVMREFNGCNYTSRSDYRDYMDTDDTEVYAGTSFFGNDKYEDKYCYKDVNKACEEYIGDLKDAINYVDYDSQVLDTIDAALNDYKERVQKEIDKKVALLSKAVASSKAALLSSGVGDSKASLLK
ncbi:ferredoxin [uncultured Phascolarctobacterium sp.]|uniref:ferredoxin n=1 Tax=uncultured Phascolarctobacterium sp. TaxID=512296 RepID=UPI0025ED6B6A|nr:ferredoxin [uncultured Phascolarctobacterium sp.]